MHGQPTGAEAQPPCVVSRGDAKNGGALSHHHQPRASAPASPAAAQICSVVSELFYNRALLTSGPMLSGGALIQQVRRERAEGAIVPATVAAFAQPC